MGQKVRRKSDKQLVLQFDLEELSQDQVRLIKSLNILLQNVMTTDDESEYFDGSAEFMRMCAAIIKKSDFAKQAESDIPYADQALEYSVDILQDYISSSRVVTYDN